MLLIMKIFLLLFVLVTSTFILTAQNKTNVLFIGNSITYFNDMPQTFKNIANSKGDSTDVTVYAPGGTGFINHVNDANVYDLFRQGNWDFVILQPGSNESPGYSEPISQTLLRAKTLKDSIQLYNPCAKILFYEISYGVWGNTPDNMNTYNATMDLIRGNMEYLADSTDLSFVPAGEAMRTEWNNNNSTLLWGSAGDIHPNAKGSYIIACSFYSSIFHKPSLGTNVRNTLSPTVALAYQKLADSIVLNNLSNWRIDTNKTITDFTYSVNLSQVNFINLCSNVDSVKWDFGDGNISDLLNISHTYLQDGLYHVTLTSYKGSCVNTKTVSIEIIFMSVNILRKNNTKLYPNPFKNIIIMEGDIENTINIYNILGQDFTSLISIKNTELGIEINTSKLPKGIYVIKNESFSKVVERI